MPCGSGKFLAALCVVHHGRTHTNSWLIVGVFHGGEQNATATVDKLILFFAPIMPLIVLLFHFIFTPPVI